MLDARAVMFVLPSAVLAVLATTLAVVVLRARARDAANRAFAAFLLLLALNYVLVAASDSLSRSFIEGPPRGEASLVLLHAAYAVQLLDPLALVLFAGRFPRPNALAGWPVLGATLGAAGALALLLAAAPEATTTSGTIQHLLVEAYVTLAYLGVFAFFLLTEMRRPEGVPAVYPRGFLLGWAVAVFFRVGPALYAGARVIGPFTETLVLRDLVWFLTDYAVSWLALALALALLAPLVPRWRRRSVAALFARASAVFAALAALLLLPAVVVLLTDPAYVPVSGTLRQSMLDLAAHSRYAVRWLFFMTVVGPAILANQVFDLDARLRRTLVAGVVGGTLLVVGVAATLLVGRSLADSGPVPARAILALALLGLLATQSIRAGRWVGERAFPSEREQDEEYRRARRYEVYREAARAVDDGRLPEADLEVVRSRLGLTEEEARVARSLGARPTRVGPLEPGSVLRGRFEVRRVLGRGAHGRALLAFDRRDSREVVLKEVLAAADGTASAAARIERELDAARRVGGPHSVVPREHFLDGSTAFLVTEFMPGGSLADRLRARGALAPAEAARVALDVLAALEAAHAAGVLHRDVKPANVLFDASGRARLADFGVALVHETDRTATSLFDPRVPGTLAYLPPEALSGAAPNASWDVYAVGTTLVEALTGSTPAPDEAPPPETPLALAAVVARARSRTDRYAAARDMRLALEATLPTA